MLKQIPRKLLRKRRTGAVVLVMLLFLVMQALGSRSSTQTEPDIEQQQVLSQSDAQLVLAIDALQTLPIKGRAAKTGYSRSEFSDGWARVGNCDVRNLMLGRDLITVEWASDNCTVLSGALDGPYSGQRLPFVRGSDTSDDIQIDHVVALSDAWQKGAQQLTADVRLQFANDPLNLLAVDGSLNQQKGDSDVASWLPPNKDFRCRYVARQIAVKQNYSLWVTEAEQGTMQRILNSCPDQPLPLVEVTE
mgnify:CR=1 FL=1